MIPLYKLSRLPAGQRRRKLALSLTDIERGLAGARSLTGVSGDSPEAASYLLGIARLALEDEKIDPPQAERISQLLTATEGSAGSFAVQDLLRLCNVTRHALLQAIGTFPAEWDLICGETGGALFGGGVSSGIKPTASPGCPADAQAEQPFPERRFFPGMMVYAEDIRSPFNLGSIFRTAEAFGAERMFISPLCVPPSHPRAQRSAMGTMDYLPCEELSLAELPADVPVFALETGGTPIGEFRFPEKGIVILGSEELGVSPEGLARASYGRVTIPMTGIKASLNVGVAFGILMQAWTAYLACSDSNPF